MPGALVTVADCRVCRLPYRAELEEMLAGGMSFARVALQLADRQPPVPAREELAAHAAGHLLPAAERRQSLAPRPLPPADPAAALELGIQVLTARLAAGDLTHIGTLPRIASTLADLRESRHAGQAAELQDAFVIAMETAITLCKALAPVLGSEGGRRLFAAYNRAVCDALAECKQTGSYTVRTPEVALLDADGMPWAAWDRARIEALREEIGDDVVFERLLARWRADPGRYYPPWQPDPVP
jgi:hypothetical protein